MELHTDVGEICYYRKLGKLILKTEASEQWTEKYMFILPATSSMRPMCLICSESVAVVKNLKQHYETKHCV